MVQVLSIKKIGPNVIIRSTREDGVRVDGWTKITANYKDLLEGLIKAGTNSVLKHD